HPLHTVQLLEEQRVQDQENALLLQQREVNQVQGHECNDSLMPHLDRPSTYTHLELSRFTTVDVEFSPFTSEIRKDGASIQSHVMNVQLEAMKKGVLDYLTNDVDQMCTILRGRYANMRDAEFQSLVQEQSQRLSASLLKSLVNDKETVIAEVQRQGKH